MMALFTFPETASGFLVLCLPVFPRFFHETIARMLPEPPTIIKNIQKRLFASKDAAPHAYPAREKESENKRLPRSWWHISTNISISHSETSGEIETVPGDTNTSRTGPSLPEA
jgi:hypothetical protein